MFVTENQFHFFIISLSCGVFSGIFYDFIYLLTSWWQNKIFIFIRDILFFPLLAVMYVITSLKYNFPSFRLFLPVGTLLGFYLYLKSFHKPVAFLLKKGYNLIWTKLKIKKGKIKNDKRKARKNVASFNSDGNSIVFYFNNDNGVSTRKNKRKKKGV